MAKITLTDVVNLENQNTAVNAINTNNSVIELAFDNTLSRDGAAPNQMMAAIDMNSKRILNLPEPSTPTEPIRVADVTLLNGSGTITVSDGNYIYPETYGAVGDGVTDDANAIRAAMLAASGFANGATVKLSSKTYLLGSYDVAFATNGAILRPYQNVHIKGDGAGSVLKVKDGMNQPGIQFFVIYPPDETSTYFMTNVGYHDFCIDFNGANNGGYYVQNTGIGQRWGRDVTIQNVTFKNSPGSQCISIGDNPGIQVSHVNISDNTFYNNGWLVNPLVSDHSSIYVIADSYVVTGNILRQPSQDTTGTAIELHGINGTCTGNTISYYDKSFNIAAVLGHTATNITIADNTSVGVQYGFAIFALDGQTCTDILIDGNTFRRSLQPIGSDVAFIEFGEDLFVTADCKNVRFTNNIISSDAAAGTAATQFMIDLGRGQYVIEGNTIVGCLGPAIGNKNPLSTTTSIVLRNNYIQDCGKTSTAASRRGILISDTTAIDNFEMSGNTVINSSTVYMTTAYDVTLANAAKGTIINNIYENVTTAANFVLSANFNSGSANGILFSRGVGFVPNATSALANAVLRTDGSNVPSLSTTLPNIAHGIPTSITLTNGTGLPISTGVSGLGTGVATALAVNVGSAGAFVAFNGALGSPSSAGTMPAHTLGGTVTGNNQVILGLGGIAATVGDFGGSGTGSGTDAVIINSGVANKGYGVYDGAGAIRAFLRHNVGNGGYIGVFGSAGGASTQILGTGDSYIAAPSTGASLGVNTQVTPGSAAQTGNTKYLTMNGFIQHAKNTVASLPVASAALEGARYGVTDSSVTTFGTTVAASGSSHVPVYCTGTAWIVG